MHCICEWNIIITTKRYEKFSEEAVRERLPLRFFGKEDAYERTDYDCETGEVRGY